MCAGQWDNDQVSDSPALWLLCDTETTGFLDSRPVMLEAAWTIVRSDTLAQLTPLRQRLCAIHCRLSPLRQWARRLTFRPAVPAVTSWPAELMDSDVQEMHLRSDLAEDWEYGGKLGAIGELDDLIDEDLNTALARMPEFGFTPVHFAGAGVARFEMNLLPLLGSRILHRCYYGPVDTTAAARALGIPKVTDPDLGDGLELDIQAGCTGATTAPHRAAADVRAAYRQVREMRSRLLVPANEAEDVW